MKRTCFLSAALSLFIWSSALGTGGDMGSGTEPLTDGSANYPYLIEDLADFDTFANATNAATYWATGVHTKLTVDIDLSGRTYTTAVIALDPDHSPSYVFDGVPFAGNFDGNGYRILNLTIDTEGIDKDYLGLFGLTSDTAVVINLGIDNVNITASGNLTYGDFTGDIGALVGNNSGDIQDCWVSGSVIGGVSSEDVGGLCGWNQSTGIIAGCYVIGDVSGGEDSGGIGGLCGCNDGTIKDCWASGSVTGRNDLGGLCGCVDGGSIINSYSTGSVTGTAGHIGGFCGEKDSGAITYCFWDVNTSGIGSAGDKNYGATGKTTVQMQTQSTFTDAGWDFVGETANGSDEIWKMSPTYPRLAWENTYLDDFNDNLKGLEWTIMASNESNFWLDETNQRLEVRSVSESDNDFALYTPNGWHLDTSQDFGIKIRYYNELDSVTWSELLFALSDSSDIENNHLQFSVCSLDDGENTGPHFYYEWVQNSSGIDDLYITRPSNDGWIFISYDAVLDEVYFGVDGYGSANSLKTVSGLLQGDWAGMNISPHLGGSSDHVEILSGQAYWDDFAIDYGEIIQHTTLTVTSPVSNELWAKGQTYDIEWSTGNPSPNVKILLFKGDSKVLTIKKPTANDYTHSWKIPTSLSKGTNYRIKVVCLADKTAYGYSDFFEIAGPIPCVFFTPIEVSEPSINAEWEMGQTYSVQWTGGEPDPFQWTDGEQPDQYVKIQLFKGPNLKKTITTSTANDGEHDFTVRYGLKPGSNYRVKVKVLGSTCSSSVDFSDDFEIKAPVEAPEINVEVPDSTSVWVMGGSYPIMWSGDYFPGGVKIKLFKGSTAVKTISKSTDDDGHYTWAKVPYSLPPGSNYRVKVISINDNTIAGFSDPFTIVVPPINVTKPTNSTEWKRGYKHVIRWTGGKPTASVKIQLLKDNKYLKTLTSSTPNDGVFRWTVSTKQGLRSDYSVRVVYLPDTTLRDTSQTFTVINSPVGTWTQKRYQGGIGGVLKFNIKNNNTFSGYLQGSAYGISFTIPLSGTYSYDYDTGIFTADLAKGSTVIYGVTVGIKFIGISGSCVNHNLNCNVSEVRVTASQYGQTETESVYNGELRLER